jgi:uncharacterized protein (DUF885 family)
MPNDLITAARSYVDCGVHLSGWTLAASTSEGKSVASELYDISRYDPTIST